MSFMDCLSSLLSSAMLDASSLKSIVSFMTQIILIQIYCGLKIQHGQQLYRMAFIFSSYIQCIGLWEQHHPQLMVMLLLQHLKTLSITYFAFISKDFCLDFISVEYTLCHRCSRKNKMSFYKSSNNLKSTKMQ